MKRSFTLTPEVAAFVTETRQRRRAKSDSEALVLLLRELMLEELAEQREWAEMAGPSIVVDIDSAEAEL